MHFRTCLWPRSVARPMGGRRALKTIVNSQYSMVISAVIGVASATYFWIIGPKDLVALVGVTVTFLASALNVIYLMLHQIVSWRYLRPSKRICLCRKHDGMLISTCMAFSGMTIITWLTAAILGLIAASKAPFCASNAPGTLEWKNINGCRLQRASVAGSLLNILNSCILVYALKASDQPFAASLRGIKVKCSVEEELRLRKRFSVSTSNSPLEKRFNLDAYSPNNSSSPETPTPPPRGRRSWLPESPESTHPILRCSLDRIALDYAEKEIVPTAVHPLPPLPIHHTGPRSHRALSHTQTATNIASSITSRSTLSSTESDSKYSRKTSNLSSHGASRSLPSIYSRTTLGSVNSGSNYSRGGSESSHSCALYGPLSRNCSSSYSTADYPSFQACNRSISNPPAAASQLCNLPSKGSQSFPGSTDSESINCRNADNPSSSKPTSRTAACYSCTIPSKTQSLTGVKDFESTHGRNLSDPVPVMSTSQSTSSIRSASSGSSNSDIFSRYARTLSSHNEDSSSSVFHSLPILKPTEEFTPELSPIPERYLHKSGSLGSPLRSPSGSRGRPKRPNSRPPMPPAKFWEYARAKQREHNALGQSPTRKRSLPIWRDDDAQPRPCLHSKSASDSSARSIILRGDAVLVAMPGKAMLRMNMNKGNIAVVSKDGSYEGLSKGRDGKGIVGKEMDWQKLLGELEGEQNSPVREDSRSLVRVGQPWDNSPWKRHSENSLQVPPVPPRWEFGWL